jgi:PilZ domain-containing protein
MSWSRQDRRRDERVRVNWSARVETRETVVEGRVVDLSITSVRIRAHGRPVEIPVGTHAALTLHFPGPDDRFEVLSLSATVARTALDGVALTFSGLPDPAGRWVKTRLLSVEARRRSPRARVGLPIELRVGSDAPVAGETLDVSAFGARVRSALALKSGDRLELRLPLDPGKPPLKLPALVWECTGDEAVLVFANLPEREFNRLGDYVMSRLAPPSA